MAITKEDLEARYPQLNTATVDIYFDAVYAYYTCYFCGNEDDLCDKGIILALVAHLITVESSTDIKAQNVNSYGVESVNTTFSNVNVTDPSDRNIFFSTTKYGQQFLLMTKKYGLKAFYV